MDEHTVQPFKDAVVATLLERAGTTMQEALEHADALAVKFDGDGWVVEYPDHEAEHSQICEGPPHSWQECPHYGWDKHGAYDK